MKLISKKTVLEYFDAPGPQELSDWCREEKFSGVDPAGGNVVDDGMPSDLVLAAALWHARTKYPEAGNLDVCSYGGLVSYLATGWYGGFGTEEYQKERRAENIVLALAGGTAPEPDGMIAFIPERNLREEPTAEFTRQVLEFLDKFYFVGEEQAVVEALDQTEPMNAARVVLGLARTRVEYERLARVADGFLKHKENISALRKAVREVWGNS